MQKPPASAAFVRAPPAGILTGRGGGGGGGGRGPGGQEAAGTGGRQPGPHRARHGLLLPQLLRVLRGRHGGELRVQPLQPGGLLPVQPHAGGLRACARLRPPRLRQLRPGRPPRPPALALLGSSLQILLGPVGDQREAEAAADPDDVHQLAAEGAGAGLCRDSLPRHLHPRGAGPQDRPHRGTGAGVVPEPSSQIPQAGARGQRQGRQRHRQQRQEVGATLLLRRRRIQGIQLQPDSRQHGLPARRRPRQPWRQPEPQPRRGGTPGTRPCPPAPQGAPLGRGGGRQRSPQHGRAAEGLAAHRGCAGTLLRRPVLLPSETERHQDKPLLIAEPPDPAAPRTPLGPHPAPCTRCPQHGAGHDAPASGDTERGPAPAPSRTLREWGQLPATPVGAAGPRGCQAGSTSPCSASVPLAEPSALGAPGAHQGWGQMWGSPQRCGCSSRAPSMVCAAGLGARKHFMGGSGLTRVGSAGHSARETALGAGRS